LRGAKQTIDDLGLPLMRSGDVARACAPTDSPCFVPPPGRGEERHVECRYDAMVRYQRGAVLMAGNWLAIEQGEIPSDSPLLGGRDAVAIAEWLEFVELDLQPGDITPEQAGIIALGFQAAVRYRTKEVLGAAARVATHTSGPASLALAQQLYETTSLLFNAYLMGHEAAHATGACAVADESMAEQSGLIEEILALQASIPSQGRCATELLASEVWAEICGLRLVRTVAMQERDAVSPRVFEQAVHNAADLASAMASVGLTGERWHDATKKEIIDLAFSEARIADRVEVELSGGNIAAPLRSLSVLLELFTIAPGARRCGDWQVAIQKGLDAVKRGCGEDGYRRTRELIDDHLKLTDVPCRDAIQQ